ncbi:MAG: 5-deoxy-glucuronate isomerase, partial [Myxococcales bacterium]|nr:5-deoxy-glucuronate isomerase [Myxococcales bacterium]
MGQISAMKYTAEELLFRGRPTAEQVNRVTPKMAGWDLLSVETRCLGKGHKWSTETGDCEAVLVIFGGTCALRSNRGEWERVGRRASVFEGMPWSLYLPRHSTLEVEALTDRLEFAYAWVPTDEDHPAKLIRPEDAIVQVRGGHNNTRQINDIIPPGFDCHRLVCVEVFTPSGNWSSYPPHKHDEHRTAPDGTVVEADLEEFYCYRFARPEGWALQRIYTDNGDTDATVVARDGDVVLVPGGYHPVSTGYGYDCYYLNFLAGSAQTLAATDDPAHAWVKETW